MALITIRKAHVKRIFPTDDDGNPQTDSDVWVDVLRIDEYSRAERPGEQGANYHLRWQDGPDYDMQEGFNTTRKTEKIKVVNPQDDSQFVEVLAIKKKSTTDPEGQHQVSRHTYDNSRDNTVREVYPRRIGHIEVPDSLDMTAETPSWADYLDAIGDGDRDLDQYVDFDIPHTFRHMDSLDKPDQHQISRVVFNTKDFAKAFADIPEDADPDHPPVRLDPFQYIVNVSFGGGIVMTASSRIADPPPSLGFSSKDGDTWDVFGPPASGFDNFTSYAHGNGVMLMDSAFGTWRSTDGGQTWTNVGDLGGGLGGFAFGKIDDPDNPGKKIGRFIGITGNGDVSYSSDGLAWTGAGFETYLGGNYCQFVNGVFFAHSGSYLSWPDVDQENLWTRIASSRDGISWSEALLWHPDSFSYGDGGPDQTVWPTGTYQTTGVAWDGNRFVVVGNMPIVKHLIRNDYTYVDSCFSASSPDGFSWGGQNLIYTDTFTSDDTFTGYSSYVYDVAAGKLPEPSNATMWVAVGQFVGGPPTGSNWFNYAWSTDGASWNVAATIPGSPQAPFVPLSGAIFTNKKFIVCGQFWDGFGIPIGMIWTSDSGTNWTRGDTGFDSTVQQFNALYKK